MANHFGLGHRQRSRCQNRNAALFRFAVPSCDGIAFDCVGPTDDISVFDVFADHQPAFIRADDYRPYNCPMGSAPETYRKPVAVFGFDRWIADLIPGADFNSWSAGNDGSNADEPVFWSGSAVKLHAIPYEGQAFFHDLTTVERRRLVDCDSEIEKHLYSGVTIQCIEVVDRPL